MTDRSNVTRLDRVKYRRDGDNIIIEQNGQRVTVTPDDMVLGQIEYAQVLTERARRNITYGT